MPLIVGPLTITQEVPDWDGYVHQFGDPGFLGFNKLADWRCAKVIEVESMPESTPFQRMQKQEQRWYWGRIIGRSICDRDGHLLPAWERGYGLLEWRCPRCAAWLTNIPAEDEAEWRRKHDAWLVEHERLMERVRTAARGPL